MIDDRAISAARNNADWYEAVFQAHGLKCTRPPFAFVAQDLPPPYYATLTTLSPDNEGEIRSELARAAERFAGVMAVKDSFCCLDLARNGFETLFGASWIWRAPLQASMPEGWHVVRDPDDLSLWEGGWKAHGSPSEVRMFPASLLDRRDVFFVGRKARGRFVAGCIANSSRDCIGLSNVFAETPSQDTFAHAADAVSALRRDLPVVGYEAGPTLDNAALAGFDRVGDLRILVSRTAKF